MSQRALVLFSGGQDSTTCLAWAFEHYNHIETIGFDYGQRHRIELSTRPKIRQQLVALKPEWSARLGTDHLFDLTHITAAFGPNALTQDQVIEPGPDGLPSSFVPGRNLLFLTLAGALAYTRDLTRIVLGVCETDYSGYPDCRDDTIKAMQLALNLGLERRLVVETPLMWLNKAETWALAKALGGEALVDLIIEETHSCYLGDHKTRHEWGYGCGTCPACELRAKGWEKYCETYPRPR